MEHLPAASSRKSSDSGISSQRSSLARSVALRSIIELVEKIAHAADGSDVDAEWLELLADAVNIHFDRVAADVVAEAEQVIDDLLLAHHAALPDEEELGQRQLARRHLDRLVV